jgi:hypothetical protein
MRKMTTRMKKFPVSIPADLHTRFKLMCVNAGVPMAEIIRKILERECAAVSAAAPKAKPANSAKADRMADEAHA